MACIKICRYETLKYYNFSTWGLSIKAEQKYLQLDKEALAIVFGIIITSMVADTNTTRKISFLKIAKFQPAELSKLQSRMRGMKERRIRLATNST